MKLRQLKLVLLFLLTVVISDVSAQGFEDLQTVKNQAVTFEFFSRFAPVMGRLPEHGSVDLEEGPTTYYTLTYTPDADYIGSDDMLLVSFPYQVNVAFTEFNISVDEAKITANHDLASTVAGTPVTIPVLSNDTSNVGTLSLVSVPVANAGTAEIVDNQVVFTPEPGFSGLTDFNYVICTYGVCDLGTVSVNVTPDGDDTAGDTIRVFTIRDQPQFIFAPADATPAGEPASGSMVSIEGVMAYQPDEDFIGDEYLSYVSPGASAPTVFHITVLDLERNQFAVEDRAYAPVDGTAKLNVLHNDLYNVLADCISFGAPQFGTLTETARKGEVVYTAPEGWSGVDQFTYSSMPPGCDGEPELQTVYVFVSNFAPAEDETTLTTPAGTPVRLTYDADGGAVSWSVVDYPAFGTIISDSVSGALSYLPLASALAQTDELTLAYCLNEDEAGDCEYRTEVTVTINVTAEDVNACIDEDCVWPGDTNNDGVVDVGDLLPIGLAMGSSGTPRLTANPSGWSAQYGEDWATDLNGLNHKYIDANGDQVISSLDTQVVMENLGLQHRLRAEQQTFTTFQLSLSGPLDAEPGDLIVLDINAGNNVVIVEDVFGFRFSFDYDTDYVNPTSVDVNFDEASWMSYDSPILSLTDNHQEEGRINTAVTRTSSEGISGFGPIGTLGVVIVEDVFGFFGEYDGPVSDSAGDITTTLGGDEAVAMNAAGHLDAVRVAPYELKIKRRPATEVENFAPAEANTYLDGKLLAYPNPTAGNLVVHLNGQQEFTTLQLTDVTGRTVLSEQGLNTNHRELSLAGLANGIYTLTITTEDGVVNRKVELIK
ncbi:T9SS type A sorting domain-containing protein [Neolewinella aurantiaca]|uniref:T9SS type A sorting domain-containing protein n=1 Tax=Neolewinella aurantiaca TaxID=2602767 RepID=A0A5C7F8N0_9BACT|nr:Ig-like domain-containing protein [Neolewinella aurantiaca]TXF87071.1 T9SS type A sorting domain-containing protein [Neolewinella aurantiaca]